MPTMPSAPTATKSRPTRLPEMRLHKPSGQARVRYKGKEHWLGRFGTREAAQRFAELLGEIVTGSTPSKPRTRSLGRSSPPAAPALSVNELAVAFLEHARQHYRHPDGKPTSEIDCILSAIGPLTRLYGMTAVEVFGPTALKAVRQSMVETGWSRGVINAAIGRIRRVFRWGVESELVEPAVLQKLEAVAPLKSGRTEAPDHPRRTAIPVANIEAVKAHVSPMVRDLMELQLLSGARPGELLLLTGEMIDRTSAVWVATIVDHKTAHHGKTRKLFFPATALPILEKYIKAAPKGRLFRVTRCAYCRAITRACEIVHAMPDELRKPKVKDLTPQQLATVRGNAAKWRRANCWSPHWLRHCFITSIRERFGIEAAQVLAGHSSADMTAIYSTKMDAVALRVAGQLG